MPNNTAIMSHLPAFLGGTATPTKSRPVRVKPRVSSLTERAVTVDGELIDTASWTCTCGVRESYTEHTLPLTGAARSAALVDRRAHSASHS
jgi:hypothetical protein